MLWRRCMTRGGAIGLGAGLVGGALLAWWQGPSVSLAGYTLWLTALTTVSGAVTGLLTLMWLRGAAQAGARLSGVRAGIVSGLACGAVVGGAATLAAGLLTGGVIGGAISAVTAGVATGALTAAAGVPLGCTVKGWLAAE